MKHTIVILSPGTACWKSRKIIRYLDDYLKVSQIHAEIKVVHKLKEILTYRTWILPTVIINGKIIARGYKPSKQKLDKVFGLDKQENSS